MGCRIVCCFTKFWMDLSSFPHERGLLEEEKIVFLQMKI